jgi:hypothetical protein
MNKIKMTFVAALSFFSTAALADASCVVLMNDLAAHAEIAPTQCARKYNTVAVKMASNRSDSKYVSYADGVLYKKQALQQISPPKVLITLSGDSNQTFSDRTILALTTHPQNFDANKSDILGMTFSGDGNVELVLKSWGNGKITMNGICLKNMLYAEKDNTLYTFSFQKIRSETGPC